MTIFKRGINNPKFIDKLNELKKDNNSFWSKIITDKDLFIAIRNEYISVYYKGCSILKLSYDRKNIIGETHYKYLLTPEIKNSYIKSINGLYTMDFNDYAIKDLSNIDVIKRAANVYAIPEKEGTYAAITKNKKNILDVEITFKETSNTHNSVDFLVLKNNKLVFYEAKHFSNTDEIRAKGDKDPKVFKQISRYGKDLIAYKQDIINSYNLVLNNLKNLGLRDIIPTSLQIDFEIKLLIFGYDRDQQNGLHWTIHKNKLKEKLGNQLVLIGNPKNKTF